MEYLVYVGPIVRRLLFIVVCRKVRFESSKYKRMAVHYKHLVVSDQLQTSYSVQTDTRTPYNKVIILYHHIFSSNLLER